MVANNQNQGTTDLSYTRLAGLTATTGSVIMIIGAILFFSSGFDLWAAVDSDGMGEYLAEVNEVKTQLVGNLSIWIVGVLVVGIILLRR